MASFRDGESDTAALYQQDTSDPVAVPTSDPHGHSEILVSESINGAPAANGTNDAASPVGCMNTLRAYWPAIKVGIFFVIIGMADSLTKPVLVKAKADFYGSDQDAALAQALFDCSVALINFFVACFYGQLMNSFGRRKFFFAAAILQIASYACLTALPTVPVVYQIVHFVYKLIQMSYQTAYIADVLPASMLPKAFAILQACGYVQLAGSAFTGVMDVPDRVFYAMAVGLAGVSLVWAFFLLPESLAMERRVAMDCSAIENPFKDIKVLLQGRVLRLCLIILVLVQIADTGIDDVYLFYLRDRAGFEKKDFAIMLSELAVLTPIVAFGLLPFALDRLSSTLVMGLAIAGNCVAWVVVGTIWAKWPIFAFAIPMAAVASMAPPIVMGVTANAGDHHGAATRLTALAAVGDLAAAFGPLIFGLTFSQLHGVLEALPLFIGAFFCAIAAYLTSWLSRALQQDRNIREAAPAEKNGEADRLLSNPLIVEGAAETQRRDSLRAAEDRE